MDNNTIIKHLDFEIEIKKSEYGFYYTISRGDVGEIAASDGHFDTIEDAKEEAIAEINAVL